LSNNSKNRLQKIFAHSILADFLFIFFLILIIINNKLSLDSPKYILYFIILNILLSYLPWLVWGFKEKHGSDERAAIIKGIAYHKSYSLLTNAILIILVVDYIFVGRSLNYAVLIIYLLSKIIEPLIQFIVNKRFL